MPTPPNCGPLFIVAEDYNTFIIAEHATIEDDPIFVIAEHRPIRQVIALNTPLDLGIGLATPLPEAVCPTI